MPLKIIWTLLDLISIVILGSGLYLWLSRRKVPLQKRLDELHASGPEMGADHEARTVDDLSLAAVALCSKPVRIALGADR